MTASKPPTDSAPKATDLNEESMASIRSLLHDQPPVRATPEEKKPRAAQQASLPNAQRDAQAHLQAQGEEQPKRRVMQDGEHRSLFSRVLGYKHSKRAILMTSLALIFYFRPWLILGLLVLSILLMAGVLLILGYDGFWQRAMAVAQWYVRRKPERAAELHQRLDRFAVKWDAVLDRFPEGSVDGLYLPDFGDMAKADQKHDAALDRRLSQLQEKQG